MKIHRVASALFCLLAISATTASAQVWRNLFDGVHQTARAIHKHEPETPESLVVEQAADEIDYLEHLIETYGSVVPKQPDIWGEARLTKHRRDYEQELAKRFSEGAFSAGLQGSIRRSDEAFLAASLALSNATNNRLGRGTSVDNNTVLVPTPIALTPGDVATNPLGNVNLGRFAAGDQQNLSLEPVIEVSQLSRYLNYLNELRRINEGDDTADAPGYALNLVRIPISVLPGKHTRKGYGAEITFSVEPYLTDDLMATTIENLIINDVVDEFAVPMARFYNNDPVFADFVLRYWPAIDRRSQNWMTVYDRYVDYLQLEDAKLARYMLDNRSYIAARLLSLAALDGYLRLKDERELPEGLPASLENLSDGFHFSRCGAEFNGSLRELAKTFDCLVDAANAEVPHGGRDVARRLADVSLPLPLTIQRSGFIAFLANSIRDWASVEKVRPEFLAKLSSLFESRLPEIVQLPLEYSLSDTRDFQAEFGKWQRDPRRPAPFPISVTVDPLAVLAQATVDACAQGQRAELRAKKQASPPLDQLKQACATTLIDELTTIGKDTLPLETAILDVITQAVGRTIESQRPTKPKDQRQDSALPAEQKRATESLAPYGSPAKPGKPPTSLFTKMIDVVRQEATRSSDGSQPWYSLDMTSSLFQYQHQVSLTLDVLGANVPSELTDFSTSAPVRSQTAQRPVPPSQFSTVYGYRYMGLLSAHAHRVLRSQPANHPIVHSFDIRKYLQDELRAAYEYLKCEGNARLWQPVCQGELKKAIRCGDYGLLSRLRTEFSAQVRQQCAAPGPTPCMRDTVTEALAWAILVHAALVDDRLVQDMESVAVSKGCPIPIPPEVCFVLPKRHLDHVDQRVRSDFEVVRPASLSRMPAGADWRTRPLSPEAAFKEQQRQEAFKAYVRCKWPIYVFNIDPITDDQNIADVFSRRREMQLAASVAVANGQMGANAALRFTRNLETDIETIALNRTVVGFAHGTNTFGWRFYPRVQTPDTPGTLGAFGQTLFGGPSRDSDLKQRELEPATRECTAIVIMPSFVPNISIESRANWFGLTNPRKKSLTMHDTMKISRNFQSIVSSFDQVYDCGLYRPVDVEQMKSFVYQLEKRLPMQQSLVPVPHENSLGAFDLFDSGVTSLGPELTGWYGAPGLDPASSTTIFLTGKRFSVLESRIVVGGRYAPFRLISRDVLEVTVPPGFQTLSDPQYDNFVDVHLATPYGPSSHLLVPVNRRLQPGGSRFVWATSTLAVTLHFKDGRAQFLAANAPPTISLRAPTLGAPLSLPVNISVRTSDRTLELATLTAQLDVRSQRYVIGGDQFEKFATEIKEAADKVFAITKPVDGHRHVFSVFGTVAIPGGLAEPILNSMAVDITLQEDK